VPRIFQECATTAQRLYHGRYGTRGEREREREIERVATREIEIGRLMTHARRKSGAYA